MGDAADRLNAATHRHLSSTQVIMITPLIGHGAKTGYRKVTQDLV
jgi:hypothetical protein